MILNRSITTLLVADSVPLSDAWKRVIDHAEDVQFELSVQNQLDAAKHAQGWVEVEMCMYCGSTISTRELMATDSPSCCPNRRMKTTLVPEGYKDPK
ncbi:TPA: hypothetical protein JD836_14930 [Citrobacter freundii]|nr:hypothetical protein [Citrobacter freundii]HCD1268095.1 hypothetical protein [Citrobacter freundii]